MVEGGFGDTIASINARQGEDLKWGEEEVTRLIVELMSFAIMSDLT